MTTADRPVLPIRVARRAQALMASTSAEHLLVILPIRPDDADARSDAEATSGTSQPGHPRTSPVSLHQDNEPFSRKP